jgi:hypothetical protein
MEQEIKKSIWKRSIPDGKLIVVSFCLSIIVVFVILATGVEVERSLIIDERIGNMTLQQKMLQNKIIQLDPKQTIKNYLETTKRKRQNNFVNIIEKLQPRVSPQLSGIISSCLLSECDRKDLDENLILALIFVESTLNPMAESSKGAYGLMQVRYVTWKQQPELKDNGVDKWNKLFWIEENIKSGTDIFKKFYSESDNNINVTLYRYNSGSQKIPSNPDPEVLKYINKILYYHYFIMNLARGNNESSKGFNR